MSDDSQLSDYKFADQLVQNIAVYAPITFEEFVIVMISIVKAGFHQRQSRCRSENQNDGVGSRTPHPLMTPALTIK